VICSVDSLSSEDVAVDFHWFTDCHLAAIFNMNSSRLDFDLRLPSTGKMFVWSQAFLLEPGSARYSSAPSITTVWSNYQTSYNDFFEVCITETVTLSPNIQMVLLTSSVQLVSLSINVTWPTVLCPHWSKSPSADVCYDNSSVCKYSDISCWTSVKSIMGDHWQWLSFNAKPACNK